MSSNRLATTRPNDPPTFVHGEWVAAVVLGLAAVVYGAVIVAPQLVLACLLFAFVVGVVVAILRRSILVLGLFLALVPLQYLAVGIPKFFGIAHMSVVSVALDVPLCLVTVALWRKNGFRATSADWFLVGFAGLGALYLPFGGALIDVKSGFMWILPYLAGRVAALTPDKERTWAKRAIWLAAVYSLLGMVEVFILGPGPRTLLYTALTDQQRLSGSAYAQGFAGLREASTMSSPLYFAALCMVALVIWWIYSRRPVPGAIIAAGLALSVTRSAWIGTAVALSLLAVRIKRKKLLLVFGAVALAALLAFAPMLGFKSDYWHEATSGRGSSAEGHVYSISAGLEYVWRHPLGSGPGTVGWRATQENAVAPIFETSYLNYAATYGIPTLLCFLGFMLCAFILAWRRRSSIGNVAAGIVLGFSIMMIVLLIHADFPLACWVWFPVGLAVGQARPGLKWAARAAGAAAGCAARLGMERA